MALCHSSSHTRGHIVLLCFRVTFANNANHSWRERPRLTLRTEIRRLQEKTKFEEHVFFFVFFLKREIFQRHSLYNIWVPEADVATSENNTGCYTLSMPPPKMGAVIMAGWLPACLPASVTMLRFPEKSRVTATCQCRWFFIAGGFLATTLKSLAALGGGGGGVGMGWDGGFLSSLCVKAQRHNTTWGHDGGKKKPEWLKVTRWHITVK